MLKAIKENMKIWLKTHERLYWYIVIGIAALAFGIVTGMGCAKLERAEAAQEMSITVPWYGNNVTVDVSGYRYYIVVYGTGTTGGTKVALCNSPMIYTGKFIKASDGSSVLMLGSLDKGDINVSGMSSGSHSCVSGKFSSMRANHDVYNESGSLVLSANPFNPEAYFETLYSTDAPYLSFNFLAVDNKLNKGIIDSKVDGNLYSDYFATSGWMYVGELHNLSADDVSYTLNLRFEVEVPTNDYLKGLVDEYGLNYTMDSVILRRNTELIKHWMSDGAADSRTVIIDYSVDVVPNEYSGVSYTFTYPQWEYMLRAYGLDEELSAYDASWRSALLSFLHVKKITTEVVTKRSNSFVYGGYTTNVFERDCLSSDGGCKDAVDVFTKVDKNFVSSDALKDMISNDVRIAEREYLEELENRVEELENQMGGMTSVEGAFGNLEGSDLWTGFQSLVDGLGSLAPSIRSLSILTGAVFAFLPVTINGIMSTTLFAICIIAIIKAIRG